MGGEILKTYQNVSQFGFEVGTDGTYLKVAGNIDCAITDGTIATGTLGLVASVPSVGTVDLVASSVVSSGTIDRITSASVTDGTVSSVESAVISSGTISSVESLVVTSGTVDLVAASVVSSGTLGLVSAIGTTASVESAVVTNMLGVDTIKNATGTYLKTANYIDNVSGVNVGIDYAHHEIHEGEHYFVECFSTLGSGGTIAFCVTTPLTKQAHMLFTFQTTGQVEFTSYEHSTWGTGGTTAIPINSNRNSTGTAETVVVQDPTNIVAGSNVLNCRSWGVSGNPTVTEGGNVRSESEIVLKSGTTNYVYLVKSMSDDNLISYHGNWYEHTPSIT